MCFFKKSNLFFKAALVALVGAMCFSCTKQTPEPEPNPGVDWGTTTIASVLDSKVGETFELKAVVAGVNEKGVILQQDGEDRIYAFKGEEHGLVIGDVVNVKGETSARNGLVQFGMGCELEKTGEHIDVVFPEAEAFGAEEIAAYMKNPSIKYVTYTGTVLISGNYTNFEIDGTDVVGSLDYMSEDFRTNYKGHSLTITGWLFGSYKTFMYTVPVDVKDNGVAGEDVPEGAIYYNTFDKELSSQTFGSDGGSWPYLDEFDGWNGHKGSGSDAVTYSFQKMSLRTNQSSKGSLSLYDGSGKNNIFFSTAPNYFIIENISLPGTKLHLSFGAQRYAQGATNTFVKSDFEVRLSADGQTWSQALDYGFGDVEDVPGDWRLASADFTLPEGTSKLYIKFVAKMSSVNRIDDVLLVPGEGGQEIVFGGSEEVPMSSIADVLNSPTDEIYKIQGQIVGIHTKGFLVDDGTGTILVFKKKHGMEVGYNVIVEGATTVYGGMKQFGESSEIEKVSEGTVTYPTPVEFKAADFDAYANSPSIKYVKYTGVLSYYKDEIYQPHYNVTIDGTETIATISYPVNELNIDKYVGSSVIVTGYLVAVSGNDTKYANTMATSIEFSEKEERPSEDQAISVKELNAKLAGMQSGASLKDLVAVVGYVAANNEGGALYQVISVVDNTGEAHSGIIVKDENFTEKTLPVGTKVIIGLQRATYDLNKGLPQIRKATVYKTDKKADIVVPVIDDSQCADYLGQYVTVKDLTAPDTATTWCVDGKSTTTKFTGAKGGIVASYVTKYAVYKDEKIAHKTANLSGVMEIFDDLYKIIPTSMADVAGFKE